MASKTWCSRGMCGVDARKAIRACSYTVTVFADDLDAFRKHASKVKNESIMDDIDACQSELHACGRANCVIFDVGKESKHVLSSWDPRGNPI